MLPALWCNRRPSPPYYPNIVTLDPTAGMADVEPVLRILQAEPGMGAFGVKDSFARLGLSSHGFDRLFAAQWIVRPADRVGVRLDDGVRWSCIESPAALADWEAAWWRESQPSGGAALQLFPPALLRSPGVSFVAGQRGGVIVAGCALTLSGEGADAVAGFSCAFVDRAAGIDREATLHALLDAAHAQHPGRPLVGYDSGKDLALALRAGFQACGPLQVWLRRP